MEKVFVTGTDTDIGKTTCSLFLLRALQKKYPHGEFSYYKPIQTGTDLGTDSDYIRTHTKGIQVEKESYLFPEPISPHRAAEKHNIPIKIEQISKDLISIQRDFVLMEGAGGLEVPIWGKKKISDIPENLGLPLLIVASTRLGTINHSILTVEVAQRKGLEVLGLILSGKEDKGLKEVLEKQTGVKVVGVLPWLNEDEFDSALHGAETFFDPQFLEDLYEREHKGKIEPKKRQSSETIWYPFTQHQLRNQNHEVVKGEGAFLYLKDGRKVFDGISSWWVNLHGHSHPEIAHAIAQQSTELEHSILTGLDHAPAKNLADQLIDLTHQCGASFSKVFFSDNGSTSVEVALKMAYQYHQNRGTKKKKFLSLQKAYHGDTMGAMSVSSRKAFHSPFDSLLFNVDFIEPDNFEQLQALESQKPEDYGAFIVEPLIQGAGGMNIYSPDFLKAIEEFCSKHHILLIFDEVFTGFGRLEHYFAFQRAQIIPDIICLSKGISGGFLPISVTMTNDSIFNSFLSPRIDKAFLHGHSYTGNPIACAASLASLKILTTQASIQRRKEISQTTASRINRLKEQKKVHKARSIGTIGAFEMDQGESYFSSNFSYDFFEKALGKGLLLRPLGKTIYTVPPLCSTREDIDFVYDVIEELIDEHRA